MDVEEDEDFNAALLPECERSHMVKFLFTHATHDLVQDDNPRQLILGYSCRDCGDKWTGRLSAMRSGAPSAFVQEFVIKLFDPAHNRNKSHILNLMLEYPQYCKRLAKLKCLL